MKGKLVKRAGDRFRIQFLAVTLIGLLLPATGVSAGVGHEILLATTTSTEASGLLTVLLPKFESETGIKVRVIAVGTGQALKLGERGDVDVVLVHSRPDEDKFMAQGYGSVRRDVMYNEFMIVGPANDLAAIRGFKTAAGAFKQIAEKQGRFVSRGDDSGTHKKELLLWQAAGIQPGGTWYREAGQGMGQVLTMADNSDAYTLTDSGTFFAYRSKTKLIGLVSNVPGLYNPYGVMPVNKSKHAHVNHEDALKFADWLVSPSGQAAIRSHKINGQSLFIPGPAPAQ